MYITRVSYTRYSKFTVRTGCIGHLDKKSLSTKQGKSLVQKFDTSLKYTVFIIYCIYTLYKCFELV